MPEVYAHEPDATHTPTGKPVLAARALTGIIDQGQFSPDSRWIAYNSDETGAFEVYVTPFPAAGERFAMSRGYQTLPLGGHTGPVAEAVARVTDAHAGPGAVVGHRASMSEHYDP